MTQRENALNNEKLDAEYEAEVLRLKRFPDGQLEYASGRLVPSTPPDDQTCDKCGKTWVKSPVQMRGLTSPTTRHPSLGDDRTKHFCDRVCLMRYILTQEEVKTLRGEKKK